MHKADIPEDSSIFISSEVQIEYLSVFVMEQIDLTFTSNMSNRTSIKVTTFPHFTSSDAVLRAGVTAPKHPDITAESRILFV